MKALVTGATGFLGGALARRLQAQGWHVTAQGRNPAALAELEARNIRSAAADLGDARAITQACQGQTTVFHCAALSSPWGRPEEFYAANVSGTENVIRGCEAARVERLVHVSTPSIYFDYTPRLNVREDAELPRKASSEYARTKLIAEQRIDQAFERGLPVVSIRPRAIFGPGDATILPRLIRRLERGDLRIIGDGRNLADLTYVDNVVDALLLCSSSGKETLGKKYNITNGQPVVLWDAIHTLADALGYKLPTRHVPLGVALALGKGMEILYGAIPGRPEPPLTRYSVGILGITLTLDIGAAKRDLGYRPRVGVEDGLAEFVRQWKLAPA